MKELKNMVVPKPEFFFHTEAMILVLMIYDEKEFDQEFDYLINLCGKSELFVETASYDWLRRHNYMIKRPVWA